MLALEVGRIKFDPDAISRTSPGREGGYHLPGYTKIMDCPFPPPNAVGAVGTAAEPAPSQWRPLSDTSGCISGQGANSGYDLVGDPTPLFGGRIGIMQRYYPPFASLSAGSVEIWERVEIGVGLPPQVLPPIPARYMPAEPLPVPWPTLDPLTLPIRRPVEQPKQLPYRAIPRRVANPFRSPTERRFAGYGRRVPRNPRRVAWETHGSGQPIPVAPPSNPYRPPRKGTKESKLVMAVHPRSALGLISNMIGEGVDFIEAIHDALPKHLQAKGTRPQDMLKNIWWHLDKIPMRRAVYNLILNHLEDMFYGKLGQVSGRGARNAHDYLGGPTRTGEEGPSVQQPVEGLDEWSPDFEWWQDFQDWLDEA